MELNLSKPICFFDLETTGTNVASDRIVEISILKIFPNGNKESKTWLVNPEMPIPPEVVEVHGISNEKVANEPTFKQLSKEIYKMIKDSDLAGFNSDRFDIPLLAEEMLRADVDFDMKNMVSVDVQTIFHKMEKRTLGAAYKFYCDKTLEGAHGAEADTMATYEVFKAQIERYEGQEALDMQGNVVSTIENDMNSIHKLVSSNMVDLAGRLVLNDKGVEVFNFGKHRGKPVADVFKREPGYYDWMMQGDFPLDTKRKLTQIKLQGFQLG